MSRISDFFFGKPEKMMQFSQFSPEQIQFLRDLLQQTQGPTSQALESISELLSRSPESQAKFEAPAMRQFQEQILPQLSEGFGGLGAGSSSAAQQTFARAGERLAESLAAQRGDRQSQAINQLMGFLGQSLTPTQQHAFRPGTQGLLGGLAGSTASSLGSMASYPLFKLLGL